MKKLTLSAAFAALILVFAGMLAATPPQACAADAHFTYTKSGIAKAYVTENGTKKHGWFTVDAIRYHATKTGRIEHGWRVIGGKLYYLSKKKGAMARGRVVSHIYLKNSGVAYMNLNAKARKFLVKLIDQVSSPTASKSKQLRACWNWLVTRPYAYQRSSADRTKENWYITKAMELVSRHAGACFRFNSMFAIMAKHIGYKDVRIYYGTATGVEHCWVRIDGKYYDAQAQWRGWACGVYRASSYWVGHTTSKVYKVSLAAKGSKAVPAGVKLKKSSSAKRGWNTAKTSYYLASGKKACGIHVIGKKLYAFTSAGVLDKSATQKLQAACTLQGSATELLELLGEAKSKTQTTNSCYNIEASGVETTYTYEHITVVTFTYTDTGFEELASVY